MYITISVLKDLVEALGDAGDAIGKIADGISRLVATGVEGYDAAQARLVHARLRHASRSFTALAMAQSGLSSTLRGYAEIAAQGRRVNLAEEWEPLEQLAGRLLQEVVSLLDVIRAERSDFVLEPVYRKLCRALEARQALLGQLKQMSPPRYADELALVTKAARRYDELIRQLERATDEMNAYIKSLKAPKD